MKQKVDYQTQRKLEALGITKRFTNPINDPRLSGGDVGLETIGELIEWIGKELHCEWWFIDIQIYLFKYNIEDNELIDALVELAIKIKESK